MSTVDFFLYTHIVYDTGLALPEAAGFLCGI